MLYLVIQIDKDVDMYKILLISLLVIVKFSYAGEVYKCTVDGKITYSQMPCANNEAEERLYKLEAIQPIDATPSLRTNTVSNPNKANSDSSQAQVKIYLLNNKIKRSKSKISTYQKKMTKEISKLKSRTYYANNNLAGATYQAALSNEMVAISNKYKSLMEIESITINNLQSEIDNLNQ